MKAIRVLLVDDHKLMRAGLRALIEVSPGIEVVAEAENGREALKLCAEQQPDVVVMDIMMPEMNGLDATSRMVAKFPNVRVLILSMNTSEEHVLQAMRAGASGYMLKNISPSEMEQAIRQVARGETPLAPSITRHVLSALVTGMKGPTLDRLTLRQREILQLVAEGHTAKEIARKLGIGTKTVESHRADLMRTLDLHNTAALVRYAIRTGLVSCDV